MATSAALVTASIWQGGPALCLGRFLGMTGSYLLQSNVSSISYAVTDLDNAEAVTGSGALVVSTTIYDTLQTDLTWVKDATGYNFRALLASSCFPTANHRYRAVFTLVTSAWGNLVQPFEIYAADPGG